MRTSCIRHPKNEPLIIIRRWQIQACDGDRCAAALLSFFEYWHNIKLDMQNKNKKANDIAEMHGDIRTQDEQLYQFHTESELEDGIQGLYKKTKIGQSLALLEDRGFISIHKNPNPRYKFDRTRYFLFHESKINQWIDASARSEVSSPENGSQSTINGSQSTENGSQSTINGSQSTINGSAITEITTETTTETTTKNTTEIDNGPFINDLLNILKNTNNYPFDIEKDAEHLQLLVSDYPTLDIEEELKDWRTYKLDKPLKKNDNPRLQIRNWCKNAAKWKISGEPEVNPFREKAYQPLANGFD